MQRQSGYKHDEMQMNRVFMGSRCDGENNFPASIRRWSDVAVMLIHCLRLWANIQTAFGHRLVCEGLEDLRIARYLCENGTLLSSNVLDIDRDIIQWENQPEPPTVA